MAPLPLPDGTCEDTEEKVAVVSEEAMVSKVAAYRLILYMYPLYVPTYGVLLLLCLKGTEGCSSKCGVARLLADYLDSVSDVKVRPQLTHFTHFTVHSYV